MATIEEALTADLSAGAGMLALIHGRAYPVDAKQGAELPYVTFERISTQGTAHLDGASDLDFPRFQLNAWGRTAAEALAVAEAIRDQIDGQTRSGAGLEFYATFQDQRGPIRDEQTRNFGVQTDYFLWHGRN